jgi:hypothetical protein
MVGILIRGLKPNFGFSDKRGDLFRESFTNGVARLADEFDPAPISPIPPIARSLWGMELGKSLASAFMSAGGGWWGPSGNMAREI